MYFGKQLVKKRKDLKLSEAFLSKQIGVSRSYIALIEHGKRLPSKKLLAKFAQALTLTKKDIIEWYIEDVREQISKY